ncbi:MAG: SWIM zinc finger family protein [Bacteroidota bacterium]|nr:SWIM zinc finger family protein [Bacteroidota bacterium]
MMQIPFNQFEQHIHETILKRGLSYFNNGRVQPHEELSPGYYEAIVEGSDNYIVRLKIQNELIVDYSCTCPYDFGPYCKHVVALLFYLQQDTLDLEPKVVPSKKPKKKRKTVIEQLDEILAEVPVDALIHYLKTQALNNPSFRRSFIAAFAHYGKAESKSTYAQQLRAVIYSAKQKHGFIEYRSVYQVGKAAHDLLEKASGHIAEGNFHSAFYISTAVLEEMNKALNFADDSDGDIGDSIRFSMDVLYELASQELHDDLRKVIFDYALKTFNKKIFAGWDWHVDMLDLASLLHISEKEANKLLKLVDEYEGSQYEEKELQQIKYNILQMLGGPEAEHYLEENIVNPSLRKIALEKAFSRKDYNMAIQIAEDGIECDAEDKPGLVYDWYDWLLKIYIALDDNAKVIETARHLYLNSRDKNQWYYDTLKAYVEEEDWFDFVKELICEINNRERWMDIFLIEEIYKREKYWDRLLQLLKDNISLNRINEYEEYLMPDYSDALIILYKDEIVNYLSKNTGRNYYQEACRYIRRMTKLGGREEADKLIDYLRNKYPARRALQEELYKV